MRIASFLIIIILFPTSLVAQQSFKEKEATLKIVGDSILKAKSDTVRSANLEIFNQQFEELLKDSLSFFYPFDSLKNVSILTSNDKTIRIYTWLLPSIRKDKYSYYGFVQLYDKKLKTASLFKLHDDNVPAEDVEKKALSADNWYGAIYYKLLENKRKSGATLYTLLGWRGNNLKTTIKVIDALVINKVPKFGAPVFASDKGMKHRIVFQYTAQAVMSLNYNQKKKMIVFDHLSPSDPMLKGNYESYGPDMTYDGYKFKDNKWVFVKNIVAENASEYDVKAKEDKLKPKEFYTPEK